MKKLQPAIVFGLLLIAIIVVRQLLINILVVNGIVDYISHTSLSLAINVIISIVAILFIKKFSLQKLAGIDTDVTVVSWRLLLFPLYIVVVNLLFMDAVPTDNLAVNAVMLLVYCISIGVSEELALRGFLQSYLLTIYKDHKKGVFIAVFAAALFFGVVHLLNFSKGLYGELSQVAFATFIGFMFGALLLRTKRLYPLIIIHALIDFVAKLDDLGMQVKTGVTGDTDLVSAIVTTLIILPCFIYGWRILRKVKMEQLPV